MVPRADAMGASAIVLTPRKGHLSLPNHLKRNFSAVQSRSGTPHVAVTYRLPRELYGRRLGSRQCYPSEPPSDHASSSRLKSTYNGAILTRWAHALSEQSLQDLATTTAGILRVQYDFFTPA